MAEAKKEEKKEEKITIYRPPTTFSNPSKLLLKYKYWNKDGAKILAGLSEEALQKKIVELSDDDAEKYADEHHIEVTPDQMFRTGYPKPLNSYRLVYETFQKPAEAFYFWSTNHFKDLGFPLQDKITDIFAASEQSAFYGASMQRLGLHEDKVTQYLATIGRMVKELFQVVREVRIIKERLSLYRGAMVDDPKIREHNEIALKGLFVDLVEGGAKDPKSVFGMAAQLQFTSLPELFFTIHPKDEKEISKVVEEKALHFNENLRTILKRKLASYLHWKNATYVELVDRESHTIKYLRQHYDAIQLYMTWIKPYLKHIKRLQMDTSRSDSAELVGAFEGSVIETEVLARMVPKKNTKYYACILLNMTYRTSPTMSFQKEGRHQGPLHMGRVECNWRSYAWKQEDVDKYKRMRDAETFQMLMDIDQSIRDAMAGLGEDLARYIEEASKTPEQRIAEEKKKKEAAEKKPEKKETKSVEIKIKELTAEFVESIGLKALKKTIEETFGEDEEAEKSRKMDEEKKNASGTAKSMCFVHYNNFKKANKMITW